MSTQLEERILESAAEALPAGLCTQADVDEALAHARAGREREARRFFLDLLVAHSEALGLYDLEMSG